MQKKSHRPKIPSPLRQVMTAGDPLAATVNLSVRNGLFAPTSTAVITDARKRSANQQAASEKHTEEPTNKRKSTSTEEVRHTRLRLAASPSPQKILSCENENAMKELNQYRFDDALIFCNLAIAKNKADLTALAFRITARAFRECLPEIKQDLGAIRRFTENSRARADLASTMRATIEGLYAGARLYLTEPQVVRAQANATKTLLTIEDQLVYVGTLESEAQYQNLCQCAQLALQAENFDRAIQLATQAYTLKPKGSTSLVIRNTARMCDEQILPASEDLGTILEICKEKARVAKKIQGNRYKKFEEECLHNSLHHVTAFRRKYTLRLKQQATVAQATGVGCVKPPQRVSP